MLGKFRGKLLSGDNVILDPVAGEITWEQQVTKRLKQGGGWFDNLEKLRFQPGAEFEITLDDGRRFAIMVQSQVEDGSVTFTGLPPAP